MKHLHICAFLLMISLVGCKSNDKTEKFQEQRDNIVNVQDKITPIKTQVLMSSVIKMSIVEDFLIITDLRPNLGKGIHLFNKNTFEYITSTGIIGNGPGEINRIGPVGIDSKRKDKVLWVLDVGKEVMWKFPLDSILNNDMYKPTEKKVYNHDLFLVRPFNFLNDSIALGGALRVIDYNSFVIVMAKLNMKNKKIEEYGYSHPKAIKGRSHFFNKLSLKNGIYVNCYKRCDLMTICDLQGNLKYNIYGGDDWFNDNKKNSYFQGVDFFKKNIVASYNGGVHIIIDEFKRRRGNNPSKFLIFDTEGNYKKTIETVNKFTAFCIDEENNRVIVYFVDRNVPLGYFNLNLE